MGGLGNKEIMAKNIRRYMEKFNKDRNEICKDLGFAYTTFVDWETGKSYPRIDKIEILANYFGIQKSDLIEEYSEKPKPYYLDPEVAEMAQEMKENPDLRVLLDASKDIKKEDMEFIINLVKKMKGE